jgi:WhiB family transcriptional regulator, redox-sensing transcriptional regulator
MKEAWMDAALCAQTDPDMFVSDIQGESPADAKKVCRACDVREQCLQYALDNHIFDGVYGGLTGLQRRKLTKA